MTPNEITTLLATNLHKELDVPFKLQLMERVKYWRSRLIKNSLDKDQKDRKFFKQTLWVKMANVDSVPDCVNFKGCPVATTVQNIPQPLRANNILFDYLGSVDGMTPFKETIPGLLIYGMDGKYSFNVKWFTYLNRRVMVYGNPNLPWIRIDGIFDDPEEAIAFACPPGAEDAAGLCDFWDNEYPMSGDIAQQIVQMILQVDYQQPAPPKAHEIPVSNETPQ